MHLFLPEVVSQALEPHASVPSLLLSQSSESPCQTTTEKMISMLLLLWPLPALSKFKTQRICCNANSACRQYSLGQQGSSIELPRMPWSDWEVPGEQIEICKRPDGSDWELGAGAFGKVAPLPYLSL